MKKFITIQVTVVLAVIIASFSSCAIGKRSVYLTDLPSKLILSIHYDTLIVKPQHTMNSAKCIYKINISVDNSQKKIYISAIEALVRTNNSRNILELLLYPFTRPCKGIFHIKLNKYKVSEPNSFEYYWRDPDKKTTKLEIIPCKSNKTITQNEQTEIIEIVDNFESDDTNEKNIIYIAWTSFMQNIPFYAHNLTVNGRNDYIEEQALFEGKPADKAFSDYICKNLIWSELMDGMSGRVIVEFIIETDGAVSNAKIIRGVEPLLDAEALRVIRASPQWTPAKIRDKPVRVKYAFPVDFRLKSN